MIAKLIDGNIFPCPRQGYANGTYHTNLPKYYKEHIDFSVADGYYPVEYTESDGDNKIFYWELTDGIIVQRWKNIETEQQGMVIDIEKLRSDIDYIAMMSNIDLDGEVL